MGRQRKREPDCSVVVGALAERAFWALSLLSGYFLFLIQ